MPAFSLPATSGNISISVQGNQMLNIQPGAPVLSASTLLPQGVVIVIGTQTFGAPSGNIISGGNITGGGVIITNQSGAQPSGAVTLTALRR